MIRLINLGLQTAPDPEDQDALAAFALWDTVTDRFLEFYSTQAWYSLPDLETDLDSAVWNAELADNEREHLVARLKDRILAWERTHVAELQPPSEPEA
jgi:hypothetical protein